jgi:hypothetical protein
MMPNSIPGEFEHDSGLKANRILMRSRTVFPVDPEWCFGLTGIISTGKRRWSARHSGRKDPLSTRRTSMRRIKKVLSLRYELKLDQQQIARSCSLSVSTVHEYLKRAEAAKVSLPSPDGRDDARVETALFQEPESRGKQKKSPQDFAAVHEQSAATGT